MTTIANLFLATAAICGITLMIATTVVSVLKMIDNYDKKGGNR